MKKMVDFRSFNPWSEVKRLKTATEFSSVSVQNLLIFLLSVWTKKINLINSSFAHTLCVCACVCIQWNSCIVGMERSRQFLRRSTYRNSWSVCISFFFSILKQTQLLTILWTKKKIEKCEKINTSTNYYHRQ